ncbi:SulP family inorganic anion transporter [Streptomyces sp. NPDC001380]|uniref:SulP family inorganic anion transporter n=1 Tax=Streptomyces sp. NPDC001380 TaxID=3364566 RepID=UPI0036BB9D7F
MTSGQPRPRRTAAGWWAGHRRAWLRGDLLGASTAWALIVPEPVAYAGIAGVPPQNAFHGAPVALALYGLPGGSRFLIVGATSAAAVPSASTVADAGGGPGETVGLSAALAVLVGGLLVAAGTARLGFVTTFPAEPALVGFLFGMALTIRHPLHSTLSPERIHPTVADALAALGGTSR